MTAEVASEPAPVPAERRGPALLRLATWNLNHWRQPLLPTDTRRAAWDYLAASIGAGVALVQEAVPPPDLPRDRTVYGEMAGHRNWGSAIVALDPGVTIEPLRSVRNPWSRRRFLLANTHPGSVAVAQLTVPGIQPITLVSVYGVMDGSALSTVYRVIADLLPLFDSPQGARVILGGDLNVSGATTDPKYLARAEAVLGAIRSLGLVEAKTLVANPPASAPDCACGDGGACGHIATWGKAELDHLFVSPSLAGQVTAVTLDRLAVEAGLSDHAAIVLDVALSPELTPHAWDEEAFAEEIGHRHGAAAREVVEKLVSWADQKERELSTATGVTAKVLTRFPTNGVTTEPELMFPVDLNLEPRASQPTISIHADGQVVVWFGGMHCPPFDTDTARDDLRRALNEMTGVHLHGRQASGWPRFPIGVLEDPVNLARLVAVLDRIASESHTVAPIEAVRPNADGDPAPTLESSEPSTEQTERMPDADPELERRVLGMVEVDSGTLIVGDPAYCLPRVANGKPGIDYQAVIEAPDEPASSLGGQPVLLIGRFGGDGIYPVVGELDEYGELVRLTIEFLGPADEGDGEEPE